MPAALRLKSCLAAASRHLAKSAFRTCLRTWPRRSNGVILVFAWAIAIAVQHHALSRVSADRCCSWSVWRGYRVSWLCITFAL